VPGGADPWGGCWPGPGNTGVPTGTVLTSYTGPCTITTAGTVIDHRNVTCATLDIRVANVVIRMSMLNGTDVNNGDIGDTSDPFHAAHLSASFTITDSTVVNGARDQCACVGYHDFTATRVNVVGGNRGLYCELRCTIVDSWTHARALQGQQHASGMREEQYTTITHSTLSCDYTGPFTNSEIGCSAALTGYADFAPIHDSTVTRNLFIANPIGEEYCSYGGGTLGKPFSGDPLNGVRQVFRENVYQKGRRANGSIALCGNSGAVTDWPTGKTGSVFTANVWDDGTAVAAA